ncbi:DNA polymerase III subunit delta' [Corynebacterium felinum]|uniref:DNA polymerase-3 subunit delta n=1 Tax=Corynebacterium felinum TaxID=131318 RepID=A0ABU2B7B4_9CORY|nr:DNA polymerase III subunit delta' [Corynebacterium felinum]MDF5821164.1 DNA polymerase III subunit delta' [Corynebacterium felinum]MDR7354490.1 DNA polymerase-3 subunit delta' [Corynebacterium felinum]
MNADIFAHMGISARVAEELRTAAHAARMGHTGSAMTHAWLFTGPPGSGRSVAAVAFAAALECTGEIVGCGVCEHCQKVQKNAHTDVVHVIPRELSISVESMRDDVVGPAARMPTVGRWRIVILDDADRLTESAANALLKTVEEPPAHTVIMLCAPSTDPQDIIPTLLSRSRHVYVPQPSIEEVAEILMRGGIDQDVARLAAAASGHHIGRARHLATDKATQERRSAILNLAELIFHGDQAFQAVSDLIKNAKTYAIEGLAAENEREIEKLRMSLGMGARGKGAQKALEGSASQIKELEKLQKKRETRAIRDVLDMQLVDLMGLYRDALMLSTGVNLHPIHPDMQGLAHDLVKVGPEGLLACIDAVQLCRAAFPQNVRPEAAMDAMVGRIRIACKVR